MRLNLIFSNLHAVVEIGCVVRFLSVHRPESTLAVRNFLDLGYTCVKSLLCCPHAFFLVAAIVDVRLATKVCPSFTSLSNEIPITLWLCPERYKALLARLIRQIGRLIIPV